MIYLVTALYCEAKPWIDEFSLKKVTDFTKFQLFQNGEISLIITKPGKLNAAIAVTMMLCRIPPKANDILLNVGIAGSTDDSLPIGSGYLIHQLMDLDSKDVYYPDLLFPHTFNEASLVTSSSVVMSPLSCTYLSQLMDMEATGIYVSAILHMKQHQLFIFKIVSDYGVDTNLSQQQVTDLIIPWIKPLYEYISSILNDLSTEPVEVFTVEEADLIQELCSKLKFSVTMRYQLRQWFTYAKLHQLPLHTYLSSLRDELNTTPCKSKKEGKLYFERIKEYIL